MVDVRMDKMRSLGVLVAGNGLLAALVGIRFAQRVDGLSSSMAAGYVALLILGHMCMLALPIGVFFALVIGLWPKDFWVKWVAPLFFALGMLVLAIDSVVLSQYRFHLNAMVLELLLGGAAGEIFRFGMNTWVMAIGLVALLVLAEMFLARLALRLGNRWGRGSWIGVLVVAPLLAASAHLVHAFSQATYRNDIVRVARFFPLYFPLSMTEHLYRYGLVDRNAVRSNHAEASERSFGLNYPRAELRIKPPASRPNILLIAVDSWRFDVLNHDVMPRLFAALPEFHRFERHRSGSNGTRGGIFSLFYGLPSMLWDDTISERRGPVLVKVLRQLDYSFGIFASAPITSPTFDRNVFVDIPSVRLATVAGTKRLSGSAADGQAVGEWFEYLNSREKDGDKKPFFGFLFFDAPHNYTFPKEHLVFTPAWKEPEYFRLNNDTDPTPIFNLYKNAVHSVDARIGGVIDDLKRRSLWDNTVVIIAGDHGQEFNDFKKNYWGHGSNFGEFQIRTPLLVRWPGRVPATHQHETSHYDVAPTLLREALGVENPSAEFSFGDSLFSPHPLAWFLAGSFDNYGIIEPDRITVKFSTGGYEIYSPTLEPADVPMRSEVVSEVLKRVGTFYR